MFLNRMKRAKNKLDSFTEARLKVLMFACLLDFQIRDHDVPQFDPKDVGNDSIKIIMPTISCFANRAEVTTGCPLEGCVGHALDRIDEQRRARRYQDARRRFISIADR